MRITTTLAAILATTVILAGPTHAAERSADLRERWFAANDLCRGLSDPVMAQEHCEERERLTQALESRGFCVAEYRKPGGGHAEDVRPCWPQKQW